LAGRLHAVFTGRRVAIATAVLGRALALNPNAAHAWSAKESIHASRNEPEEAIEAIERARRLSPFDPYTWFYAFNIALAHFAARRFEQASEWADRTLHDQPHFVSAMRIKVAALAHLGYLDAARAELSRVRAIDRKLTIAGYREYAHFLAPEVLELNVTGLRLAACRRNESSADFILDLRTRYLLRRTILAGIWSRAW
jgi:tetratricopeptide (TPR) repeat protein